MKLKIRNYDKSWEKIHNRNFFVKINLELKKNTCITLDYLIGDIRKGDVLVRTVRFSLCWLKIKIFENK